VVLVCLLFPALGLAEPQLYFGNSGYTNFGEWYSYGWVGPYSWQPGALLDVRATLIVLESHLSGLATAGIKADGFCLLITGLRGPDWPLRREGAAVPGGHAARHAVRNRRHLRPRRAD